MRTLGRTAVHTLGYLESGVDRSSAVEDRLERSMAERQSRAKWDLPRHGRPDVTMINQSNRKAIDIVGAPTLSGVAANLTFRLDGFGGDF
jgi:hypothetical protein